MKRVLPAVAALVLWAGAAPAADEQPAKGPVPAWVKPVAAPAPDDKMSEAPIRLLLQDQQVSLEPGQRSFYFANVLRIQTPQGLGAGSISIPWRPDTDNLTVHRVNIRRGDKLIDVLDGGQTFTVVRREANLENAMLDGVLTANIQPEGLQVGDVLEFAGTITSRDPVMKDHVELISANWDSLPVARAHVRVEWPSAMDVRVRQRGALPAAVQSRKDGRTSFELTAEGLEPVPPPNGAPARFLLGREVELSSFKSWSELAQLMAPLYARAAVLPADGPLQVELARIKALSDDPLVRAEAALALVQERIRYVALQMGEGGLVPADAQTTWSRRFGDCKGKTALLIALLHGLGIEAEPVAVSTVAGDAVAERLPMVSAFDHVLVRARIAGRTYWLDGTRLGDRRLANIPTPNLGWGLPLLARGAELVRIVPAALDRPAEEMTIEIDAREGLAVPAPTKVEMVYRGDAAYGLHAALSSLSPEARDRTLRDFWKSRLDYIDAKSTTAAFDAERMEHRLTLEGLAKMDWSSGSYYLQGTDVGYEADFSRETGPGADAPFAVPHPFFFRSRHTILLPPSFFRADPGQANISKLAEVNEVAAGVEFKRSASLTRDRIVVETSQRSLASEFPARDAPAAQAALGALANRSISVRKPRLYAPTEKELEASFGSTLTSAAEFIERGVALLDRGRHDEAIADFSRAIEIAPKNGLGYANRGIGYAWKNDEPAALKDLAVAETLDPRNPVLFRARGLLAENKGLFKEAIAHYTKSLELDPGHRFARLRRADARRRNGDLEVALAEATAAIDADPADVDFYLLRANILRQQDKREEVAAVAKALSEANPDNDYALVAAARIYGSDRRREEAMRLFDRAIALKPEGYIYLNRYAVRPREDRKGRLADLDSALRLQPDLQEATLAKVEFLLETGDRAGALALLAGASAGRPDDQDLLVKRGALHASMGKADLAEKDFAAALRLDSSPSGLNELCWEKAVAGVSLESALAQCDAAIAAAPRSASYHDSRGLVLLRLGRWDDAIAAYSRAIELQPRLDGSLFGRAIAWSRKGEKTRSDADAAAALAINPEAALDFEAYGLKLSDAPAKR